MRIRGFIILLVILAIIGATIFVFTGSDEESGVRMPKEQPEKTDVVAGNTIIYTNFGFSPATLRVKRGAEVTFRNESSVPMWPASAVHPTHTVYPGSDINKCDTAEAVDIFDACERISGGEEWPFIFDETGSWTYHNHLAPQNTGTVIVEE